uniref:Ubiquitin-conjugating enzyme E2 O n=1 Tax=Ceratitis capitata TaxID=7213 RepID=W8BCA6_CERCA
MRGQRQQHSHYYAVASLDSAQKTPKAATSSDGTNDSTKSKEYAPKILFNISPTPFKSPSSLVNVPGSSATYSASGAAASVALPALKLKSATSISTVTLAPSAHNVAVKSVSKTTAISNETAAAATGQEDSNTQSVPDGKAMMATRAGASNSLAHQQSMFAQNNQLLNSAMMNIERAFEKTCQLKSVIATSQDDSGNYSRNENCDGSSTSHASYSDLTTGDVNSSTKVIDDQKSVSCSSIEFNEDTAPEMDCVRLCALLKEQLVKCIQQIREKYYKGENLNLSEVFNFDGLAEETKKLEQLNVQEEQPTAEQAVKTPTTSDEKQPVTDEAVARVETNEETASKSHASVVSTPIESNVSLSAPTEYFQVLPTAPAGHKFQLTIFHPNNTQQYYKAVQREHRMLKSSLPPGVWVKVFEDRMDLLSVMIEGPKKTPYEDGLFFFDIQLGRDYPKSPPQCSYISYCSDRLNPNLYEDGKVCVSLLGTWAGRDSEVWGPNSTLLQVIVSIQGLILVPEPYFNEAGYEKQKGTQQGSENSRMYNEMVIIKMVQSSTKLLQQPPELFRHEIHEHWKVYGFPMYERIKGWMELSKLMPNKPIEEATTQSATAAAAAALQDAAQQATVVNTECNAEFNYTPPDFPLVPASRGFCLSLAGLLDIFKTKLITLNAISK